ncbi:hypothetical protein [Actinokineospora iranica]|uniref:Secreted protein n=1 Tax=Actinokineospora iranica TaxID=1271860 RepID=A0A1G6LS74_9PSEU|nr:hypothetical protein [Actinokineospora iranica]SDC45937.1 hypothetical protein SAMN05216174_102210 [Actinokineospora iranica]
MKTFSKAVATGLAAAALTVAVGGVASATEATPASADAAPIWLVPGVDLGALLAPATGLPGGLAPVFGLLNAIGA